MWAQVWDVDSGLDTERTAVFVDGKRLPGQVSSTGIFEQQVTEHLSIGTHQATIKAWDKEGNYSQADWDFEVRGHQIDQAPNQSQRSGLQPRVIVIHATAGNYPYDYQALMGARKVSSHFYVRKSGYIVRMVPDRMSAWHAGKSSFKGISAYGSLNSESLGIEIESRGRGPADYTPAQVEAVAELVNHWQKKYGISDAYVTGHSEITARKSDPKGFPWGTFWGNVTTLRAAAT